MSKAPLKTDVELGDIEEDAEKAVAGAIEEVVPAELQAPALSTMDAVLAEARRRPVTALIIAAAVGYVAAALIGR